MLVPKGSSSGMLEIKRSKFFYCAEGIMSHEDAKRIVLETRSRHSQANHVVYAYVLGLQGDIFGMSDDHEPKHTAGRPALEVVKGSGITNVLVVIVRYFGGIQLGTGGLVKAYGDAARNALAALPVEQYISREHIQITVGYSLYEQTALLLSEYGAVDIHETFLTNILITARVPCKQSELLKSKLQDLSSGGIKFSLLPDNED